MLIYNYQKEFLGIDEDDLKALGFSNLSQLRNESADFADLFVKTPGFVHNFKHVHWIDFVTCAEGNEDSKVIIHANGNNYKATLDIKTAFLVDDPTQKAYIINLLHLRALSHAENEQVAGDILEKPTPRVSTQNAAIFNTPDFSSSFDDEPLEVAQEEVTHDPYETSSTSALDELETNPNVVEDIYEDTPIDIDDDLLKISDTDKDIVDNFTNIEDDKKEEIILEEKEEESSPVLLTQVLNVGPDYVYDPHLASDELGLPVDLIEEFIQDFISQAVEFKDALYKSLKEEDIDQVKILSHKLKGVAANLRIEDAFEVLTTINTSDDLVEIKRNLNTFYIIIDKLQNKDTQSSVLAKDDANDNNNNEEDDELILSFKDDFEEPKPIELEEEFSDKTLDIPLETIEIDVPHESELAENVNTQEDKEDSQDIQTTSSYDKTKAANEIGIDSESFQDLFKDYLKESSDACGDISQAIEHKEVHMWKKIALKLKGMSDNMRIHEFTSELESIINTQDSDIAKEAIEAIKAKLQKISDIEV